MIGKRSEARYLRQALGELNRPQEEEAGEWRQDEGEASNGGGSY